MDIFNEAIIHTTALYDYKPRTLDMVQSWFLHKHEGKYPVTGIFNQKDKLLGFATYGPFRERLPINTRSKHSVYVRSDSRGKGLGTILLRES